MGLVLTFLLSSLLELLLERELLELELLLDVDESDDGGSLHACSCGSCASCPFFVGDVPASSASVLQL